MSQPTDTKFTQTNAEEKKQSFQPGQAPAYITYLYAQGIDINGQPLPAQVQPFHAILAWTKEEIRPIMNMTASGKAIHDLNTKVALETVAAQRKGRALGKNNKQDKRGEKSSELNPKQMKMNIAGFDPKLKMEMD
jgi:hypothetical protein